MFKENCDNFVKYTNVESRLLFGNPNCSLNEEISICIPAYKRASLLKEAIESALGQNTIINYKVIVVDDDCSIGVTETSNIIADFSDRKLVYYKNTKNIGLFGNMNRCFELAKTKYVALLHDDDLLKNNYIETISKYLHRKSNIGCICVSFNQINPPFGLAEETLKANHLKLLIKKWVFKNKLYKIPDGDNYFLHRNVFGPPTCGIIFNRDMCLQSGGWNEDYFPTADWFYMIYFNKHYSVYRIPDVLASYRWECNTSLKPKVMNLFYQHSNDVVDFYKAKYKLFYPEISTQILCDHQKYGVKIEHSYKYSKVKTKLLIFIQRILNLRYISFN
jgi:glycosyltransferase involved in cell wall biosynthesis